MARKLIDSTVFARKGLIWWNIILKYYITKTKINSHSIEIEFSLEWKSKPSDNLNTSKKTVNTWDSYEPWRLVSTVNWIAYWNIRATVTLYWISVSLRRSSDIYIRWLCQFDLNSDIPSESLNPSLKYNGATTFHRYKWSQWFELTAQATEEDAERTKSKTLITKLKLRP